MALLPFEVAGEAGAEAAVRVRALQPAGVAAVEMGAGVAQALRPAAAVAAEASGSAEFAAPWAAVVVAVPARVAVWVPAPEAAQEARAARQALVAALAEEKAALQPVHPVRAPS